MYIISCQGYSAQAPHTKFGLKTVDIDCDFCFSFWPSQLYWVLFFVEQIWKFQVLHIEIIISKNKSSIKYYPEGLLWYCHEEVNRTTVINDGIAEALPI